MIRTGRVWLLFLVWFTSVPTPAQRRAPVVPRDAASLPAARVIFSTGDGRVKGTVMGGRSEVVAARIIARSSTSERDLLFLTTSDGTGSYLFDDLAAGTYQFLALAAGFRPAWHREVEVRPPFRNILDFRLQGELAGAAASGSPVRDRQPGPGAAVGSGVSRVVGRVEGEGGAPVPDAEFTLTGASPSGQRMALSGDDGFFMLGEVVPDLYELAITAPGSIPIILPDVVITAERMLEVQVRLVDYPVELAVRRQVILPPEHPLPPRFWWTPDPGRRQETKPPARSGEAGQSDPVEQATESLPGEDPPRD